jgi:hypothetical protein
MKRSLALSIAAAVTTIYVGAAVALNSVDGPSIELESAVEFIEMEPLEVTVMPTLDRALMWGEPSMVEGRVDGSLWSMAQP